MVQSIKQKIFNMAQAKGEVTVAEIKAQTRFSRAYINRILRDLRDEGKIILLGKANRARYILARKDLADKARSGIRDFQKIFRNQNLSEDVILDEIKRSSGIFTNLPDHVARILDYAFSEMLNNAIEHSRSKTIKVRMKREEDTIRFDVIDYGIGVFTSIMSKKNLKSELEAIQDLLKGKQTTAPKEHTGEGIFFTSKSADVLLIKSSHKRLTFNNVIDDIFIDDTTAFLEGTRVSFSISAQSKRKLQDIFKEYSGNSYEFSKTKVVVKLYRMGNEYVSRSQARRIISGLEKFDTLILDFKDVQTVGQAFADEIFRVWQTKYPHIKIVSQDSNENIDFMIKRAKT